MENPSSTVNQDGPYWLKNNYRVYGFVNGLVSYWVCGSFNGLVCLHGEFGEEKCEWAEYWVRFWNPATMSRSRKSPCLHVSANSYLEGFGFGYDNSSDAYMEVAIICDGIANEHELRVHCKR